jgi:2'-5' RNA ligase
MNTQFLQSPAIGFTTQEDYEYLLVVNPSPDVNKQIMEEKQYFFDLYKEKVAVKTKPHITVANFLAKEAMEETIIRYMHRIISTQKSFIVTCNNYSGFPPHTIFIRVLNKSPFRQLAASLKVIDAYVQSNGYPPARLITNPHITIARRLQERVYEKAMLNYSQKLFHASFVASELVLLKRKDHFDTCKQVTVFKLMPEIREEPEYATQGQMNFE